MEMIDLLNWGMRWLHISSMTVIVGGMLLLWLGSDESSSASERAAAAYRPWLLAAMLVVLISGMYNFVAKMQRMPLPSTYHAVFGVKFLLVLHILVSGFLAVKAGNPKRRRQAAGAAITGFVVLGLSAALRSLTM